MSESTQDIATMAQFLGLSATVFLEVIGIASVIFLLW